MYASRLASMPGVAMLPALGLPPEAPSLDALFAAQPTESLAPGAALFWEGDAADYFYRVSEGCLRLYRILPDGRRAIMGFVFGGEMVGLSCLDMHRYTAEAVTAVRVRRLSRSRLHAMGEGAGELQRLLFTRLFEEMMAAHRHIIVLGQMGAEERVAHFLASAACRTRADRKRPVVLDLPMTRLDIADYLGLTIETVCRILSKFKRDGLIALEGRHRVILRSLRTLQEIAGEPDGFDAGDIREGRARHLAVEAH
ncbi:helix-turn-helix domain-containing protein [Microvirga thermotolerans]|uniref:Helix-turn-helix domain-containing protein n=1 Tax=Microvirga thermotolerans TaxID=2651334 RepID=A0A5P9JU21_9HYPH|nr:helix-turn-helix domain-containing protein [Microvirga thermotolerans]QFU16322.1 helix-turn-helix domain-containing protein [Microvirga thermotolerans]